MDIKKGIIIADTHLKGKGPTKNFRAVLNFLQYWQPDILVLLGDFMDFESLNPWAENNFYPICTTTLEKEYKLGNDVLDRIDNSVPRDTEKWFHEGNHERRVDLYTLQHPGLRGMVEYDTNLFLQNRGYKIVRFNDSQKITKRFYCTHGHAATTLYHARKMAHFYRHTIIYGHRHENQVWSFMSPIDRKDYYYGKAIGTLGDMNPWFMRNRPNNWMASFSVFQIDSAGYFNEGTVNVINGRFLWDGEEFTWRG